MLKVLIVAAAVAAVWLCGVANAGSGSGGERGMLTGESGRLGGSDGYDMYAFAQFWTGSTCNLPTGSSKDAVSCRYAPGPLPSPAFEVHGLWPTFESGAKSPMFCNKTAQFNAKELTPVRTLMDVFWASMDGGPSEHFWEHEWDKHGTCTQLPAGKQAGAHPTQLEYFSTVLGLRLEMDMGALFASCGITPTFKPAYTVAQMVECLDETLGVSDALISCSHAADGVLQLNEVWLSMDLDLELIDTPPSYHTIYYPTMGCKLNDVVALPPFTDPLRASS